MNVAMRLPDPTPVPQDGAARAAIVTASYAPDLERCRLLCETIDRHMTGFSRHYILVEHSDVKLFRQLESSRRVVVDERDLLPSWLHSLKDPTSLFKRRIWLSLRTQPLRGWHVQQLRRIAIAAHTDAEGLIYCDSDVVVLKDFDCATFWKDSAFRLFRRDNALLGSVEGDQKAWSANAGKVLGITPPGHSPHDYIATLIGWHSATVRAMCAQIETATGMSWVEAIGRDRRYSECMIYGRYVDEVIRGQGHFVTQDELCRVYWRGPQLSDDKFREFIDEMAPQQVAIGMQSFIGTDIGRIRRLVDGR